MNRKLPNFVNFVYYKGRFSEIYPGDRESDGTLAVEDYLTDEEIGYFPNLKKVSKVIGGARNLHKYWNGLEGADKIEMLEQASEELKKKNRYDELISRAGGFPIKFVKEARENFANYLNTPEQLLQENPGKGPVVAITSVTTPEVQPYIMIESLLGNCSVVIKGSSSEPFSAYLLAEISGEIGLPVQFITYKTNENKSIFAAELYKMCEEEGGYFILMGNPSTLKKIVYHEISDKLDVTKLPIPNNIISFTSHGGGMIVDESANIENAVQGAIHSFRFPKACKVPTGIFVNKGSVDEFTDNLIDKISRQKVGNVLDKNTDVATVSEEYWNNFVEPFLRVAKSNGEVLFGGDLNQPTVIKGNFNLSLLMEPQYPVYCIEEIDDMLEGIEKINEASKNIGTGRILDLSVYSSEEFFKELEKLRRRGDLNVYTLHKNRPTTSFNSHTAHEGIILRKHLSEPNFVDE
ncbi:MAG TPA: aldehyde dehydrogenase [Candidatus Omnitrophica bacterium]|nr:aldehyde dehydrogenase [Candidatus Omnitrophota bacterium]